MIGEEDIKEMASHLGSAPPFNPLDPNRNEAQQVNEWKQWSAQRLFLDRLLTVVRGRRAKDAEDEKRQEKKSAGARAAVRRPGLQIQ